MASCKVGAQVPPHLFIDDRDMTIMRVVYMEHGLSLPALPGLDLGIGEGEMQEMHAGCLAFRRAPFNVALRRGGDLFSIDAEKDVIFHPAERTQYTSADLRIVNFEHQGAGQFATIGNHRIISGQFILELFFTAFFDPQHFVDLPPHRIPILKMDADMRPYGQAAEPLAEKVFLPLFRRPAERRVGKEGVRTCRSRWSPYH